MIRFLRMGMRTAAAVLALSLAGCAIFRETYGIQEVDNWVRRNEPLAESGKMKWSDFYAQYLEKVSAAPVISQSPVVERLGILITASLFYEQGRLDRAGFDSVQSIVRTYQTIDDPTANMLARNALVRALEQRDKAAGAQSGAAPREPQSSPGQALQNPTGRLSRLASEAQRYPSSSRCAIWAQPKAL